MARPPENALRGIALKIGAVAMFITMATLIKAAGGAVPPGEAVFFRSFFALPVIIGWLIWRRQLSTGLKVESPLAHIWRGMIGITSMGCMFAGLAILPLSEATAIQFAMPLFLVIMAAVLLGETVRIFRISAVLIGFFGVMIVMWPRLTAFRAEGADPMLGVGALLMLCGAFFAALAQVTIRKMTETEESSAIVFWFSVSGTLFCLVTAPFGWVVPPPGVVMLLIGCGLVGGVAQILLTAAFSYADASIIAPFEYTSILFAVVVGYTLFGEVPTIQVLIGAVIVIASGVMIIWRERQLRIERNKSKGISSKFG